MGVSVCTVGTNVCGYELQQSSAVDCQWTVASDYDLITACFKDDGTWRLIWAMVPGSLCSTESVSCAIAIKWKKIQQWDGVCILLDLIPCLFYTS